MNIFKKNEKNTGNRLPTPDKVKRGYRWYCSLVATVALMGCCTMTAFAAPAA
ncbi:MAG: glutamyl-tRNA amidotransferase, partial [Lawsonibacter sp.]|nr:glutamyl-tRNA amidotransferase [Lawsonibacter sp.]